MDNETPDVIQSSSVVVTAEEIDEIIFEQLIYARDCYTL